MTDAPPFNFAHVIGRARQLEAKMKEISDRHKAELEPFNAMKIKLRGLLLQQLQDTGQQNTATPNGGCHQINRITVSLDDPDEFMRHVIGTEEYGLLDRKANKTAVEEYLHEHGALPPGVKYTVMLDIGLTAPTKANLAKAAKAAVTPKSNPAPAPVDDWEAAEALAEQMADQE